MEHTNWSLDGDVIEDVNGNAMATVHGNSERVQDRGKFIVTACNAHDELLEACLNAKVVFAHMPTSERVMLAPVIGLVDAAIAKATNKRGGGS